MDLLWQGQSLQKLTQLQVRAFYIFSLNIFSILIIVAADFVAFQPTDIENRADIRLFPIDDFITLEYDDAIMLKFTPEYSNLISILENQPNPEFIRTNATANIIDDDGMCFLYDSEQ